VYLHASEEKRRKIEDLLDMTELFHTYETLFTPAVPVQKLPRSWDGNKPLNLFTAQPLPSDEVRQKSKYSPDPKKPKRKVSDFVTEDELEAMIEKRKADKDAIRTVRNLFVSIN
jgi:hypothetical protein